ALLRLARPTPGATGGPGGQIASSQIKAAYATLLKLGFEVGQSSMAKYMGKRCGPPSQGWRTFLRSHAPDIGAIDLPPATQPWLSSLSPFNDGESDLGTKLIKISRVAREAKSRTALTPMMPLAVRSIKSGLVRRC